MKLSRKVGATSEIWQIFIADSSSTTGAGLASLAFNSGSLTAYYHRDTDTTATAISLVTMTVGTFTSSGFKEIDATNMPGWYQFCPPNAALASGAKSCGFHLKGATNMAPLPIEVDLDSQVDVTHWNGTAVSAPATAGIPEVNVKNINNVAAATPGASGGILISGSNSGTTTLAALTVTGSTTMSDGLLIARSSSNTSAITATGNGTGSGFVATSGAGATGDGVQMTAASTNGNGLKLTKTGTGKDLNGQTTNALQVNTTQYNSQTAVTDGNNLPSVNLVDIAGSAVATGTAQLGVNVVSVAAAASNLKKNTALAKFEFLMTDSTTHAPKTGVTVTATRSIDGAAFGACANAVTEVASGIYYIDLAAADLNGNVITLRFTGTASDDRDVTIITQP